MAKTKMKAKTKNILLIVLSCVLIFGALFGIIALFSNEDDSTTKKVSPSYSVGGLTADGKYLETNESIYTKDAFECVGLTVTPVFTSTVSYEIYFYGEDNQFISKSGKLTDAYKQRPELAKYARIVITPNDDQKVSWYEVNGYAKQLTIEVDKEQKFELKNLFVLRTDVVDVCYKNVVGTDLTDDEQLTTVAGCVVGELIDVTNIAEVKVIYGKDYGTKNFMFTDADGLVTKVVSSTIEPMDDGNFIAYVTIPEDAVYLGVYALVADPLPVINVVAYK